MLSISSCKCLCVYPSAARSMRSCPQPQRSPGVPQEADLVLEEDFVDTLVALARALPLGDIWPAAPAPAPAQARAPRGAAPAGAAVALLPAALALQVLGLCPSHAGTRLSPMRRCVEYEYKPCAQAAPAPAVCGAQIVCATDVLIYINNVPLPRPW